MKGLKPESLQQRIQESCEFEADQVNIFQIPAEIFEDFKEIDEKNIEMFEFLAYQIVINFITKKCIELNKWDTAMEFPDIIASGGR